MRCLIIVAIAFLSSCASVELTKSEVDKVTTDMASYNSRLLGYLFRKEMKDDVSGLTKEVYLEFVTTRIEPSEREYAEFLEIKDLQVVLRSQQEDFVVCLKSVLAKLVLCDRASTFGVDFVRRDVSLELQSLIKAKY